MHHHSPLAGLNQHFERICIFAENIQLQGGIATDGPESACRIGDICAACHPDDGAAELLQRFLDR